MQAEEVEAEVEDDEPVPVFGTWPRIYAAVLLTEALTVAAIAAFSLWRW